MKDTQLKVLSIINLIWFSFYLLNVVSEDFDGFTWYALAFVVVNMWLGIRLLTKLK